MLREVAVILFLVLRLKPLSTFVAHDDWEKVLNAQLKYVSISNKQVWGINNDNEVFACERPCENGIDFVKQNITLTQIDADDYEVWGVDDANDIYVLETRWNQNWINIQGKMKYLSVSGVGEVWGIDSNEDVYKCLKPCFGNWELVEISFRQIDAGMFRVYGVDCKGDVYYKHLNKNERWKKIGRRMKYVSCSGREAVFGIDRADAVYVCEEPCTGQWKKIEGSLKQLDAGYNMVYGVNKDNELFRMAISYQ